MNFETKLVSRLVCGDVVNLFNQPNKILRILPSPELSNVLGKPTFELLLVDPDGESFYYHSYATDALVLDSL